MCPFSKIEKSGKSLHPSLLQNGSSQPSALDNITFCFCFSGARLGPKRPYDPLTL